MDIFGIKPEKKFLLKATEEKIEMTDLQNNNRQILCNLLPAHVAAHFIDNQNKSHMVSSVVSMTINFMLQVKQNYYLTRLPA